MSNKRTNKKTAPAESVETLNAELTTEQMDNVDTGIMTNPLDNEPDNDGATPTDSVDFHELSTAELLGWPNSAAYTDINNLKREESCEMPGAFDGDVIDSDESFACDHVDVETPTAEIEAETDLLAGELLFDASKFEPEAEIIVDMYSLPADDAPPVENKVTPIAAAIRAMGVESNFDIIDIATKMELISKAVLIPDVAFFRKSFGDKARKLHLRNYAPGYTLETFIEVGLAYHEYKSTVTEINKIAWKPYANQLSYALLGMAVLTGREPGMPNGKYTKIGPSFGKHQTEAWAKWFYANELCKASTIKAEPAPVIKAETPVEPVAKVEAPVTTLPVETVESIDAELIATIQAAVKPKAAPRTRKTNKAKAA